jgi:hypothetical protein
MRKSFLPTIVVLMFFLGCATPGEVTDAKILKYGIYTATELKRVEAQDTLSGKRKVSADAEFVDTTTKIPAILGTRFGFRYVIKGSPEGKKIDIRVTRTHPRMKNPRTGKVSTESKYNRKARIGIPGFLGFKFDEEWELVPGDHIFKVYYKDRQLLTKTFTVYLP